MPDKSDRTVVAEANEIKIVPASEDEAPDYWLLSGRGDEFPIHLSELHDVMHAIHHLHDEAHHH